MAEIAERLTAGITRRPALLALRQRLQVDPAGYRSAQRPLWAFAGILIVVAGLVPFFAAQKQILLVQQSLYLGLLALSLNLLVNTTGLISFGHAMFLGFGAYMVAVPFAKLGWSPLAMLGLTPVIGAVAAFLIGFVVFRGRELYFALLTLGVGQLVWAGAHGWQGLTGGTNGTTGVFAAEWLNPFVHPHNLYWFIFGVTLFCTAILYVVTKSPFGDALRAIRENRRRAEFTGLWVKRYELTAFVVAGMFGAIAGGLQVIGETQIASGQIDWRRSAIALIVALIGGVRYFLGPFAGAVFWLFVFDFVVQKTALWDTVLGIVVLVVALLLSGGLSGIIHWLLAHATALVARLRPVPAPALQPAAAPSGDGPSAVVEAVHLPTAAGAPEEPVARRDGAGPPILEVEDVTKAFGGLVAVDQASLSVRRGTIHAIIGPNGAGKTTLFNVVTGLMKPDRGRVVIEGEDVTGKAAWRLVKRGLGRSFQQTNLFWELPSLTNLTLAESAVKDMTYKMWGDHPATVRDRSRRLLERMGLRAFADVPAIQLSHGDQRSLEVAAALAVEARLLLLDEPTAGLSPAETRQAVALITRIAREENLTVLFVEHDMEVVFGIADWVTVLHRGRVLGEGTPDDIRRNEEVQKAYLGEAEEPAGEGAGA